MKRTTNKVNTVTTEAVLKAIRIHPWAGAYVPVNDVLKGMDREIVVSALETLRDAGQVVLIEDDRKGYGYAAVGLR